MSDDEVVASDVPPRYLFSSLLLFTLFSPTVVCPLAMHLFFSLEN